MKTPINTINHFELTNRLTYIVQQAYFRRSRQLPANIADIVDTLKGDLIKAFPDCPIETIDEAIISETLNNPDTPLSPTFFFQAVKKAWFTPKTNFHQWDGKDEDLAYWCDRVKSLERAGLAGSEQHRHAREMVEHYLHGDTEQDTIALLDLIADAAKDQDRPLYFDVKREYYYLVLRNQLACDAFTSYERRAKDIINLERVKKHQRPLDEFLGASLRDLHTRQMHCAVVDWLRRCNTQGTTPSAILTPLSNESTYQSLRRTIA